MNFKKVIVLNSLFRYFTIIGKKVLSLERFRITFVILFSLGEMIISAVAIRNAHKLANGYRSPNPPQSPVMDVVHNRELIFLMLTGIAPDTTIIKIF